MAPGSFLIPPPVGPTGGRRGAISRQDSFDYMSVGMMEDEEMKVYREMLEHEWEKDVGYKVRQASKQTDKTLFAAQTS